MFVYFALLLLQAFVAPGELLQGAPAPTRRSGGANKALDKALHSRGADKALRFGGTDRALHSSGTDKALRSGGADKAFRFGSDDKARAHRQANRQTLTSNNTYTHTHTHARSTPTPRTHDCPPISLSNGRFAMSLLSLSLSRFTLMGHHGTIWPADRMLLSILWKIPAELGLELESGGGVCVGWCVGRKPGRSAKRADSSFSDSF